MRNTVRISRPIRKGNKSESLTKDRRGESEALEVRFSSPSELLIFYFSAEQLISRPIHDGRAEMGLMHGEKRVTSHRTFACEVNKYRAQNKHS